MVSGMEKIGSYLERLRLEAKLSLSKVERVTGIDRNNLRGYEKGKSSVPESAMKSLSSLYGVEYQKLKVLNTIRKLTEEEIEVLRELLKAKE